jgi:hypothetical protein
MTAPGPASSKDPLSTDPNISDAVFSTDHPAVDDRAGDSAERKVPTIWEQMGGPSGMIDSGLPVVVFVIVNAIAGLTGGIIAALAAGALIFLVRLVRRKPVTQAVGGLLGVGVAAFIAHRSGSAGGYFLLGIYSYLVYGGLLLLSMIVRVPAIGLIWEGINGRGLGWRSDRALVRRYDFATAVWVVVFAARFLVQNALLGHDEIGWLAFARIAMGYPLYLIGIGLSVWIVMRGTGWTRPPLRSLVGRKS